MAAFFVRRPIIAIVLSIVTVLVGCDAPASETARIREHIELQFPHVEVEFHDGGQPLYPYLVGVE